MHATVRELLQRGSPEEVGPLLTIGRSVGPNYTTRRAMDSGFQGEWSKARAATRSEIPPVNYAEIQGAIFDVKSMENARNV